ncbi:MAG: TonB-dependent receptor [Ignavibacteriales bacterium]
MKYLIVLLLFSGNLLFGQGRTISGKVIDSETSRPLVSASVMVEGTSTGTVTNENGEFNLSGSISDEDIISVSFIGYNSRRTKASSLRQSAIISLEPQIISSQTVLVTGSIGKEGITPLAFSKIKKSGIKEKYIEQDVPEMLSSLPSTTFYSESGSSVGYNYLSIRGFDQRRISVAVNGIPQNDPEDHNVYWLDFPDILSSTELIQVQRGAGSGVIGYPSIGGSINIITSSFSNTSAFDLSAFGGSYNTRKYSASFSSGLINNTYSIYTKLSKTLSSGYRNNAWSDFNSYHVSAVRYDKNLTTQINFFGGPVSDGLAYTGLPKFAIKDRDLRKLNYSYWEASNGKFDYFTERRPDEVENFSQPHFELLNEYKLNENISLNSALFMVLGNGFYDYDGSWADTSYFRLTAANGFNHVENPGNALIRAQVENKQYGWIPRASLKHNNGELVVGAEVRMHRSLHWGSISYADNLPLGLDKEFRYYQYKGAKDIINFFANENYNLNEKFNVLGEIQVAYNQYRLFDEKFLGTDFKVRNTFFNPRLGLNYKLDADHNIYLSLARVTREPRLKNYYDAAESSGGEEPQFERNPDGSFNYSKPLVEPETMNDLEIGTSFNNGIYAFGVNVFYMLFNNEIVKNGTVDRFGQPVTGNMGRTVHSGVEINGVIKLNNNIEFALNGTYGKNYISEGQTFIKFKDPATGSKSVALLKLDGNQISAFPEILLNGTLKVNYGGFLGILSMRYVGKYYSDNYDRNLQEYSKLFPGFVSYDDNVVDPYYTADLMASYEIRLKNQSNTFRIFTKINNIFDNLYAAYAIGEEFFPAAERNYIIGLQVGL